MSTPTRTFLVTLPDQERIIRKLGIPSWNEATTCRLIPALASHGRESMTAETLTQMVLTCVADTNTALSNNDLLLIVTLLCEGVGREFLREATKVILDLRQVQKHNPIPEFTEL